MVQQMFGKNPQHMVEVAEIRRTAGGVITEGFTPFTLYGDQWFPEAEWKPTSGEEALLWLDSGIDRLTRKARATKPDYMTGEEGMRRLLLIAGLSAGVLAQPRVLCAQPAPSTSSTPSSAPSGHAPTMPTTSALPAAPRSATSTTPRTPFTTPSPAANPSGPRSTTNGPDGTSINDGTGGAASNEGGG